MKSIAVAAFALIVGIVLGGLPPRAELRALQQERADAAKRCEDGVGSDLVRFLGATRGGESFVPASAAPRQPSVTPPPSPAEEAEALAEANPEAAEAVEELREAEAELEAEVADGVRQALADDEELELARTALALRQAQARAALVEQADPDSDQLDAIDASYDAMNERLEAIAAEIGEQVLDGEPSRRDAMRFAADALDAMLSAEQEVLDTLDPEQRLSLDDEALSAFSHVSPALVDVLSALDR
jgi:phosphoenolpyruvate-protein kinase (PTS system EI component)